ncbi:hypothetical protein EMPS_09967 [Entomortierella parvispora]|uniref:non-specific serine/threonine protein kinase n=1 Tax=Entomortierella parvispora TaxID=205924 RepID=A0A9P3HJD9_9FUNG|nr:hypothetical protein EMPS_09967 [Entomortierella parvispora]
MASGSSTRVGNILLGNCIGKGAFGSVWRGLNLDTATTVAVKQINLSDIPQSELANIMMEIDLLKKLNHPNIVKYYGFEKTSDNLNIILELCENGSLRSLCKNFGKLPEHLGAMYITQVLDGLVYLHDQGVIHRDIKGANILATKDGLVKLADFGVATLSNDVGGDTSVAGTPYWMAPEIIELSGATTASDIWSLGCTVIELLDGEPPYHDLQPMGALYKIVDDEHPPIPESVSAIVRDFLMQCFQKDCNLRVSAKKLSKHPWIQMSKKKASGSQRSREKAIPAYEEAVKSVQQWNEALKGSTVTRGNVRRMSIDKGPRVTDQTIEDIFNTSRSQGRNSGSSEARNQFGHGSSAVVTPPAQFYQQRNGGNMGQGPKINGNGNGNGNIDHNNNNPTRSNANNKRNSQSTYEPEICTDNWDDDFADGISSIQLAGFRDQEDEVSKTIRAGPGFMQRPVPVADPESDINDDDFEGEIQELKLKARVRTMEGKKKPPTRPDSSLKPSGSLASRKSAGPHAPVDLVRSRSAPGELALVPARMSDDFENYRESEDDDFSDLFEDAESQGAMYPSEGLTLQTRLSNHSWFGNDAGSDEEDPFAEVDEGFDEIDLEANIAREKYARTCASISEQFRQLEKQRSEKQMEEVCDRLISLLTENPDMRGPLIANHGAVPLLDLIETCNQQSLVLKLLNILNMVTRNDFALQESLCLVGAIPVLIRYTSKRYGKEIQQAAASFIQQICHTNPLTLQMFISCRGLRVLIDFLQGNYSTQQNLVFIAINGIHSVFNLQSMTPRNDFCRLLAKQGLLEPLSATLHNTLRDEARGEPYTEKIVQVLLIFSQGDSPVKELLATRQIIHRMLDSLQRLTPKLAVVMLKCIKNISMNSNTLDVLQTAGAIHTLVKVLGDRKEPFATDISNHVLTTLFNLCRINKSRQEEAAQAGIIPYLQKIAESASPLKQFALPILCDLAHAGRACRTILWSNDSLLVYLRLFKDPYWQVNAMDAVLVWLQDETADVEQILVQPSSLSLFVQAFLTAKANSFENILEPLHKIIRLSPAVACGIALPPLFQRLLDRLAHPKAVVRLNLLRILRAIFDVHPERLQLVLQYGISDVVVRIAEEDSAVLVKELAKEILDAFEESDTESVLSIKDGERSADGSLRMRQNVGNYDSFLSSDDFFALRSFAGRVDEANSPIPEATDDNTPLQQYVTGGVFNDFPKADAREVDELFQNEIDDLDVAQVMQGRTQRPGAGPNMDSLEGSPRMTRTPYPKFGQESDSESDSQGSDTSEDDKFVTSRIWIEEDSMSPFSFPTTGTASESFSVSQDTDEAPTEFRVHSPESFSPMEEEDDNEPRTVRFRPPFGHQKSKSLGEILESCLDEDIEKSHRMLEGVQSKDLSESMILRSGLPKIRLELLDMDSFPVWNRRDLEVDEESEEENEGHTGSQGADTSSNGVNAGAGSWVDGDRAQRTISPRSTNDHSMATSAEELTKILEEFHGTRRKRSTTGVNSGTSSGSSSGQSSENATVRFGLTPLTPQRSLSSIASELQNTEPIKSVAVVPPVANVIRKPSGDFGSMVSGATWDEPFVTCKESRQPPGLTLVKRQEYDDSLQFSDDSDDSGNEEDDEDEEGGDEDEEGGLEEEESDDEIEPRMPPPNVQRRANQPLPPAPLVPVALPSRNNNTERDNQNYSTAFSSLRRRRSRRLGE